ncbi:MAG: ferrous iron transporter B, partial [Oligosphaeraceae bacterium]|nr:ferrous iron transporter B [Oligosphaeraceae bacterium]
MQKKIRVALAGNPNCGKTSIFNQLTGTRQHTGNYPGVTVESKSGYFRLGGYEIELIDLPGIYSLSSSSPEEAVAFEELIAPGIDLIINVIDSSLPRRSFYLTTQLAELHIPMLLAFNMSDEADKKGLTFKTPELEKYFGARIVRTMGTRESGVSELREVLDQVLEHLDQHDMPMLHYGEDVNDAIAVLAAAIEERRIERLSHIPARFFAIKLLERDASVGRIAELQGLEELVSEQIHHLNARHAINPETFMADCRYALISGACRSTVLVSRERRREISERIDSVMTNKYVALPLFLLIMYVTFWFTFTCATPLMEGIESACVALSNAIQAVWPQGRGQFL